MQIFKKMMVFFWFLWWASALWTDIVGGLSHLGYLQSSWAPDTNFPFLVKTLAIYPLPTWMPAVFFIAILLWMSVNTLLFARASLALIQKQGPWRLWAERAFIVSLLLWMAFFIADQLVMQYDLEENHMVQGGFELLCFLSLYLLPEKQASIKAD